MKKHYKVHARGDEDLKTLLCRPETLRPRRNVILQEEGHFMDSYSKPEFKGGIPYVGNTLTITFCVDCAKVLEKGDD